MESVQNMKDAWCDQHRGSLVHDLNKAIHGGLGGPSVWEADIADELHGKR